ncbi:glycosyltransferase family 2 protein [Parabacteroides sp. AM08-6]|uniref:glycosyltransferase family 2 protein n=1 Tax=Parabacteroides sp. AM08-6 TaxID=2292053 RepID=UPI000EFDCC05|nr:glycosyltransferase family 2 protein [Parabacteroides sp. AM08-6]RHJ79747.1 glycosyltransferase [Parabacteroides sp. AM08-6]
MLSIITVCFNSEKTITRTLESVLNQKILPYEYILIDGGSEDNTVDIIKKYEAIFLRKNVLFKWISEKDKGIYDAMNKGVSLVSGDWVHFLNSDDYYVNNYSIESIVYYLNTSKADVVYGNLIKGDLYYQKSMSGIKKNRLSLNMLISCPVQQPVTFYKRSVFNAGYSFDINYKISADYKMFVQLILNKVLFQYVPVYITFFTLGGVSTKRQNDLVKEEDLKLLRECNVSTFFMRLKHIPIFRKFVIVLFDLLSKC